MGAERSKAASAAPGPAAAPRDMSRHHAEAIDKRVATAVERFRRDAAGLVPRTCPLCGYHGRFTAFGRPPRLDARCAKCASLERHRLYAVLLAQRPLIGKDDRVLHFAPEAPLRRLFSRLAGTYETADLSRGKVDHLVDIGDTGLPAEGYTRIVCNHVLEHVDDAKALAEMRRLLAPGSILFLTTPVIEGWAETYENPAVTAPEDRVLHFGQKDHLRYYGRDLRDRIRAAGFDLEEFIAVEPEVLAHGLIRGETIFIARKTEGGA